MESLEFSRAEGIFLKVCNTSIPGSNPGGASQASVESRGFFFCTKADCWEKKKGLTKPKKESILINNS